MNIIDLFAGCGGLSSGFHEEGFKSAAFLEWDKKCIETLKANFRCSKFGDTRFFQTDIRDFDCYMHGGENNLKSIINRHGGRVSGIIGGPPCQAYSVAGRVRDPNGMQFDYRNFLFEAYCKILKELRPKFFVFENVMGMLSAKPNGISIPRVLFRSFEDAGYYAGNIGKKTVYNFADLGGPQNRKRVIIFGVDKSIVNHRELVESFHSNMRAQFTKAKTVADAISDLTKIYPVPKNKHKKGYSHEYTGDDSLHQPRYHNLRDINIFRILSEDSKSRQPKYNSVESLKKIYEQRVGRSAKVHKYYVLKENQPSNLIPAHLYKDGLRHIHPDPMQARSITAREAARLQTFRDDFVFVGSRGDIFKMIGNAVPPTFARKIAKAIKKLKFLD